MPLALAIGAGAGLLKAETLDRAKADRERKLAAATARWSPWTGLKAQAVQEPDPLASMLAFGGAAGQIKTGLDAAELNQKLGQKALDAPGYNVAASYNASGNPMASSPVYSPYMNQVNQNLGLGFPTSWSGLNKTPSYGY